jgi:hypothetical protein
VADENKLDFKALNIYLVEGIVEVDPMDDKVTIRTVDQQGNPLSFDPIPALAHLKGQEVRLILTPLASVETVEEYAKKLETSSTPVDPRKSEVN